MKICPHCQTEYTDTKQFCRLDGSLLVQTEAAEVSPRADAGREAFAIPEAPSQTEPFEQPEEDPTLIIPPVEEVEEAETQEETKQDRQAMPQNVLRWAGIGLAIGLSIAGYCALQNGEQTFPPSEEQAAGLATNQTISLQQKMSRWPSSEISERADKAANSKDRAPTPSFNVPAPAEPSREQKESTNVPKGSGESVTPHTEPIKDQPRGGRVITAAELGLQVSGQGKDETNRSLMIIQQEVETNFPKLQEAYEAGRDLDQSLMGSLILTFNISPNGQTSDIHFHSTKVASTKLQESIWKLVQEWRFSQASKEVHISYPLLFLPPEVDTASIIAWERATVKLGSFATVTPKTVAKKTDPPSQPAAKPTSKKKKQKPKVPLGMYTVHTSTQLRSRPSANAPVVAQLRYRIRVRVVRAIGSYLEVHSRSGKPPGFVHKKYVAYARSR
ncbi:MAG: AgmX/PglI C-terminal domain-containing protein [Nitrososphaerales archaeon]